MIKKNLNNLNYQHFNIGNERRKELVNNILSKSAISPSTVEYEDIDSDFKRWVTDELKINDDNGLEFPTMTLISNQRFSEYAQSWSFTDTNNNLLLNFKAINRENNPQYGKIQSGLWNIPGNRFYTIKKLNVLDDNGTESGLLIKMKQPTAVDIIYKLSIFTTKFSSINDFNTLINEKFNARQCYIRPNGHFMPMILDTINDDSEYSIDDRQFYSQTYRIKVLGYIITKDDYRLDEVPLRKKVNLINAASIIINKPDIELEEEETPNFTKINIKIKFPKLKNQASFTIDTDFICEKIEIENILSNYHITVNECEINKKGVLKLYENDKIDMTVKKINPLKEATITLNGYDPNSAISNSNNIDKT